MISSAWKCLLLWQISMLGGAFEQERGTGKMKKLFVAFKRVLNFWKTGPGSTCVTLFIEDIIVQ